MQLREAASADRWYRLFALLFFTLAPVFLIQRSSQLRGEPNEAKNADIQTKPLCAKTSPRAHECPQPGGGSFPRPRSDTGGSFDGHVQPDRSRPPQNARAQRSRASRAQGTSVAASQALS